MATTTALVPPKTALTKDAVVREPATLAGAQFWTSEDRYRLIAEAAYFNAERRGFAPGGELEDWLAAELEVDEILGDTSSR
jgi:hypothetical protein